MGYDWRAGNYSNNVWDNSSPVMTADIPGRSSPGKRKSLRMNANKVAFCFVDPDYFRSFEQPPIGVESAMLEVFGRDACKDLKVRKHPFLGYWCLYERHKDPSMGENLWQVVEVYCEDVKPGVIPEILRGDPYKEPFAKFYGEFRVPCKRDFEEISNTDKKRHTIAEIEAYFDKNELQEQRDRECEEEARTHDFLHYYFNMARDEANQEAGSGQRMSSYATVPVKENPERWAIEQKNGYKVRTRVKYSEQNAGTLDKISDILEQRVHKQEPVRVRVPATVRVGAK